MKLREYFLYEKKRLYSTIRLRTDTTSTFVYALIWMKTAYPCGAADTEEHTQFVSSRYSPKSCYADAEETCWIKCFLFFFSYKKYSHRFTTFRLNHWCQTDYSDDVFDTFLCLDSVNCLAVSGTVTNLPVYIQNILNCVLKTNKAFTGLERHGGKWLMTKCSFWGGVTL